VADALLELRDIRKSFGAVEALKGVSFDIQPGEVVTLVGDNGAGKSTLIKIISGVHEASSGEIYLNGQAKVFKKPADAMEAGIETVYQHLALIEELDVADNVYLGRETIRGGFFGKAIGLLNRPQMRQETGQALSQSLHRP
jgi:simple sugar transport system ATP-binding protein